MNNRNQNRLSLHRKISITMMSLGVVMMVLMIIFEDEPGGIPLLMIVSGFAWFLITKYRTQSLES